MSLAHVSTGIRALSIYLPPGVRILTSVAPGSASLLYHQRDILVGGAAYSPSIVSICWNARRSGWLLNSCMQGGKWKVTLGGVVPATDRDHSLETYASNSLTGVVGDAWV